MRRSRPAWNSKLHRLDGVRTQLVDFHAGQNAGKRKLADDMRKKMLQRAGKLPLPVKTVREGRGSLSVEGRRRAAVQFAESLKDDVARTRQPTITQVAFGPYPDAFAHAFGFWEPGHVKTANSPGG